MLRSWGVTVPPPALITEKIMAQVKKTPKLTNANDLASLYLRTAGFPDTALNRRILRAWFFSESSRDGLNANVLNNNPLFITTRDPNSTYFKGEWSNHYKYMSYSTPLAGAQAWASLLRRGYPGMYHALQKQDPTAFGNALGQKKWGTSARTWRRVFNGLPGIEKVGKLDSGATTAPDSDSKQARNELGAFYMAGKPLVTFPRDHKLTAADVAYIMDILDKSGYVPDPKGPFGGLTRALALDGIRDILKKHIGEKWNEALIASLAFEIGDAAISADPLNGPLSGLSGIAAALNGINEALDPNKWAGRIPRFLAVLAGGLSLAWGLKILVSEAGVKGIGSGGGGGGSTTIINSGGNRTVPAFVYPEGGEEEEVEEVAAAPKRAARGTSNRYSKARAQQERTNEWRNSPPTSGPPA